MHDDTGLPLLVAHDRSSTLPHEPRPGVCSRVLVNMCTHPWTHTHVAISFELSAKHAQDWTRVPTHRPPCLDSRHTIAREPARSAARPRYDHAPVSSSLAKLHPLGPSMACLHARLTCHTDLATHGHHMARSTAHHLPMSLAHHAGTHTSHYHLLTRPCLASAPHHWRTLSWP